MHTAHEKLTLLRQQLTQSGATCFIVPNTDEFQGEYIPASSKRLEWLTGFSGSAGTAIILQDKAAFFTDGRYTLQAKEQVDSTLYELHNSQTLSPQRWIEQHLPKDATLGYDPWLHTEQNKASYHAKLVALSPNPIDGLWKDRPSAPSTPITAQDMAYSGENTADKIARISPNTDALILTAPDSICWLLNMRGNDVPYTPFSLCYAMMAHGKVTVFSNKTDFPKLPSVTFSALADLEHAIGQLAGKKVQIDPASASSWFFDRLEKAGATIIRATDPCQHPKACKNRVEINGARAAHIKDGVAVCEFLSWLYDTIGKETITEISLAETLLSFRRKQAHFVMPSFATIAGYQSNGAIVHYHAEPHSNKTLQKEGMLLLDSGGQYLEGTTDITRTMALGNPTGEQKDRFTRVLKGHIKLAMARFPKGTTGSQLDSIARYSLWQAGCDYDHGTGHGVGSFLSVHEGPQRISKLANSTALQPGMILSNEPGYYKEGEYGIRIENLVTVVESIDTGFLEFETMTCVPIDIHLVEAKLLTADERSWLNSYHAFVRDTLSPKVSGKTLAWLKHATEKL